MSYKVSIKKKNKTKIYCAYRYEREDHVVNTIFSKFDWFFTYVRGEPNVYVTGQSRIFERCAEHFAETIVSTLQRFGFAALGMLGPTKQTRVGQVNYTPNHLFVREPRLQSIRLKNLFRFHRNLLHDRLQAYKYFSITS